MTFISYGDEAQSGGQHWGVEVLDRLGYHRQGVQACEVSQGVGQPEVNLRCIQTELLQCRCERAHSLQVCCPHMQEQKSRQLGEGLGELCGITEVEHHELGQS